MRSPASDCSDEFEMLPSTPLSPELLVGESARESAPVSSDSESELAVSDSFSDAEESEAYELS